MNNFLIYLLESSAILAVLYTVYWIFLRKDTFFHVNRFYLLASLLLSLLVPLIDFSWFATGPAAPVMVMLDPILITADKMERIASSHLAWIEMAGIIYFTGVVIFSVRFIAQLLQLAFIIRRNRITRMEGANIVFVDHGYSPFSFFNLIFIRKEYYIDGKLTPVLAHEKIHVNQLHTLDLIFLESGIILQWFNPFAWLLGRSVKSIHEFLADEGVIKNGFLKSEYQTLILNEAMGLQVNNLTNNFNVSLIKNRITMMTKARSATWTAGKVLMALPALVAVLLLFAAGTSENLSAQDNSKAVKPADAQTVQPQDNQEKVTDETVFTVVETMPSFPGGQEALFKYIVENVKYPAEAKSKGIQGTVFIQFVVEKDGAVTHTKILRGIGYGCDEEGLRVVSAMPRWIPGKQKDKAVRVQFNMPIKFTLGEKTEKKEEK